MGFLSSLFAQTYDRSPSSDYWYYPIGEATRAGVRVTRDQMLRISSVLQGIRFPSQTIAGLPRFIFQIQEDGRSREKDTEHPLNKVLRHTPNPWQTSFQFVEMMNSRAMLEGIALAEKVYEGDTLMALIPLESKRLITIEQRSNGRLRYIFRRTEGTTRTILQEEMFALCGFGVGIMQEFRGIPLGDHMREAAGLQLAIEAYGSTFFGNSQMPRVVLKSPHEIKEVTRQRMKADWQRSYGTDGQHGTALLEAGTDIEVLSTKNDEAQFLETKKAMIGEFARFTDVTPHRLHDLEKSSYNNVEQMSLESVVYGLTPHVERWEETCYRDLLSESDRESGRYVEFILDGLLRGDTAARAQLYQSGINTGWLTRNEVREKENMNPIEGLDTPLQPQNMAPVGENGRPILPEPPAPPARSPSEMPPSPMEERAKALAMAAAERVLRREQMAIAKWNERKNGDGDGWRAQVRAFYADHVEFIEEALACDRNVAVDWCASRCRSVLELGQNGLNALEKRDDRAIDFLAREALR